MTTKPRVELCVAGLVYFEVFVPGGVIPPPGEELFVDNLRLGLGGALNTASVAAALGLDVVLAIRVAKACRTAPLPTQRNNSTSRR